MYDVSGYVKHPGGKELFDEYAGTDASKAFDDEGHSKAAVEEMKRNLFICFCFFMLYLISFYGKLLSGLGYYIEVFIISCFAFH